MLLAVFCGYWESFDIAFNPYLQPSKIESEVVPPKLKSIIITNSRIRLGSQDSSEKQVTFQDSTNNTEASSLKTKKVKFAEDTVFDQGSKAKRGSEIELIFTYFRYNEI